MTEQSLSISASTNTCDDEKMFAAVKQYIDSYGAGIYNQSLSWMCRKAKLKDVVSGAKKTILNNYYENEGAKYNKEEDVKRFYRQFKRATGRSPQRYYKDGRGISFYKLPPEIRKFVPSFRLGNIPVSDPKSWEGFSARFSENPALALMGLHRESCGQTSFDEELFKRLKEKFTNGEWKWLCKQSVWWMLQALKYNVEACVKLRLRYSHFNNPFVKIILKRHRGLLPMLEMDLKRYEGAICKYGPFPVVFQEIHGSRLAVCTELQAIADYAYREEEAEAIAGATWNSLFRRAQEWHRELAARRPTYTPYIEQQHPPLDIPGVWKYNGYIFTRLTTQDELFEEGKSQHHCISAYYGRVASNAYAVYRIEGLERATLGIEVQHRTIEYSPDNIIKLPPMFQFSQCYKACNGYVSSETDALAHAFVMELNKPALKKAA